MISRAEKRDSFRMLLLFAVFDTASSSVNASVRITIIGGGSSRDFYGPTGSCRLFAVADGGSETEFYLIVSSLIAGVGAQSNRESCVAFIS